MAKKHMRVAAAATGAGVGRTGKVFSELIAKKREIAHASIFAIIQSQNPQAQAAETASNIFVTRKLMDKVSAGLPVWLVEMSSFTCDSPSESQSSSDAMSITASLTNITHALQRLEESSKTKVAAALRVLDEDAAAWEKHRQESLRQDGGDLDAALREIIDGLGDEMKRRQESLSMG